MLWVHRFLGDVACSAAWSLDPTVNSGSWGAVEKGRQPEEAKTTVRSYRQSGIGVLGGFAHPELAAIVSYGRARDAIDISEAPVAGNLHAVA